MINLWAKYPKIEVTIIVGSKTMGLVIPIDDIDYIDYAEALNVTSVDGYVSQTMTTLAAYRIRQRMAYYIGITIEEALQQTVKEQK